MKEKYVVATVYTANNASLSSGYWNDHNPTDKCEEDKQKYWLLSFDYSVLIIA